MAYTVSESKEVVKEKKKLQKKVLDNYNKWKEGPLTENPETAHEGTITKFRLQGITAYKKRFGDHRAIYTFRQDNKTVFIFKLALRNEV